MKKGGLFISLSGDSKKQVEETLRLYLDRGVYGQHRPPEYGIPSAQSRHYNVLADYASCRKGRHVFFFFERTIYYGGQLISDGDGPAFYLNGEYSPLGREAEAPVVWDESERYQSLDGKGLFETDGDERCQPFLIQFEDKLGLAGRHITSDQFYIDLSEYPYPVPSNSMEGMGFCTLTERETEMLLDVFQSDKEIGGVVEPESDLPVELEDAPISFDTDFGPDSICDVQDESHLEASVLANPDLLPDTLLPDKDALLCRQVPVCPYKPPQYMDKADVCYYTDDRINDGTFPNTIIELKYKSRGDKPAGKQAALQMKRYAEWLDNRLDDRAEEVDLYIFSPPGFTGTFDGYISDKYLDWIHKIDEPTDPDHTR